MFVAAHRLRDLLGLLALVTLASRAASGPVPSVAFEGVAAAVRGDDVTAVAYDRASGRLAIGDGGGVLLGRRRQPLRRVLRRGPVRALAFLPETVDPERSLLVATELGLYRVDSAGDALLRGPGTGELARRVVRLAVAPDAVAVATGAGAFVSPDAHRWQRLAGSVPSGPAAAIALRAQGDGIDCWAAVGGRLWRVGLRRDASGFVTTQASRITIAFAATGGGPVDVRFDLPGADVVVLYPGALALRRGAGEAWEVLRPGLPPGSRAVRLVSALEHLWLGTDSGLLEAPSLAGPWRRAPPPAGGAAVRDLAGDDVVLYAATARGLFTGSPSTPVATAESRVPRTPEPPADPSIQRVHVAALSYLSLQPHRIQALQRGLGRRGWLPVMSFRVGAGSDQTRRVDFDEAFLSGETRRLTDRDHDRSDQLELGLTLSWDLGDTTYHPEAIDLSREARAVIELRDDVLDEITQFYFERHRVLAELARQGDRTTPDAERLRLRAAELAAGIDAWTGGWFSRNAAPLPP